MGSHGVNTPWTYCRASRKIQSYWQQSSEAGIAPKHSWKHENPKMKIAKARDREARKPNHNAERNTPQASRCFCGQTQGRTSTKANALVAAAVAVSAFLVFTTVMAPSAKGAVVVELGAAGDFTILSSAGITTTAGTSIVGNIGVSPIAATAITGFSLTLDPSGQFALSPLVTGKVFAASYSVPTPTVLATAIGDMQTAYTDAAGRSNPDFLNLYNGNLDGQTLAAGLYKWGSAVTITNSVTISGGGDPNAVWIFQIDNRFSLANGANIFLSNGAQARNIFWQSVEGATLGTNSHFEGILLTATDIAAQTGASMNGNLYAQTAVTLQSNAITQAIPEPAAWTMFIVGLGAVAFVRRKWDGSHK